MKYLIKVILELSSPERSFIVSQMTACAVEDLMERVRDGMTKNSNYTVKKSLSVSTRLQKCRVHKIKALVINYLVIGKRSLSQT
jgi:hypothetical protein